MVPEDLISGVRQGDRRTLARTITLVESRQSRHQSLAAEVIRRLVPFSGQATRVGITGVPGVGKSTFIESFGSMLTASGHKVAVLAVDPSSNRTRGSILGDKTRMPRLAVDSNCYIRPSPGAGELGGVAAMTREAMIVCEAAGFDVVLVETVGVGQSENTVAEMVDFFLALMLPGAGDELQGIKKGIIELADLVVVNKADGNNKTAAELAAQHYGRALRIVEPKDPNWQPRIRLASGMTEAGLDDIWNDIQERMARLRQSDRLDKIRLEQDLSWMATDFQRRVLQRLAASPDFVAKRHELEALIRDRAISPTQAARALVEKAMRL